MDGRCFRHLKFFRFFGEVKQLGAHPNGPFFYSLNNVPKDKIMRVEFYLPVKENIDAKGDMKFHSFYSVEQMVSTRIKGDFERNTEMAYSALFQFLDTYNLKQMTPPYHIIDNVGEQQFVTIKVGYIGG